MPLEKELLVASVSSVLPVALHWCSNGLQLCNKHWIATGTPLGASIRQCGSSGIPVYLRLQWSSSVFQIFILTLDRHWNTIGCLHQPAWFQWHPSVLEALVVFQCVPNIHINTESPLEHYWVLASASVVPVASQCTCGSSGILVWAGQWYPSVQTESGLEARVIRSGHFPAWTSQGTLAEGKGSL